MGISIGFSRCSTDTPAKTFSCGTIGFSSCSKDKPITQEYPFSTIKKDVNPNKFRYTIISYEIVNGNTIVLVHYHDCTTFFGKKLLLLKGTHDPRTFSELDPHFLDDDHLVIARFIPTKFGYDMARASANEY